MINLASALMIGKITYGIQAWGGTNVANRQKLQKTINQAAHIVLGPLSYRSSVPAMMTKLGWSSIDQLIDHHTTNLAVAIVSNEKPEHLLPKLSHFKTRITRSSDEKTRIPPSWRREKSCWSFTHRAILLLNNTPENIITCSNKAKRSKLIKQHTRNTTSYYVTPIGTARRKAGGRRNEGAG